MDSFRHSIFLVLWINCWSFLASSKLPNILFILADDLGWGNIGFHGNNNGEVNTPNMDYLATESGLLLMRHYTHYVCSPTRSSLQSGRLPVHVNLNNSDGLNDPYQGVSINMTCIATKLKIGKNYTTHFVGKWDAGMAAYEQIPISRGYDTSFGYLGHTNGYFTQRVGGCNTELTDLWDTDKPAFGINDTQYEEFLFAERVYTLIDQFGQQQDDDQPFFLVYASHIAHDPLQIPKEYLLSFDNDENLCGRSDKYIYPGFNNGTAFQCRSTIQSMVNLLDVIIGNITKKLKANNLWDDTLIVFTGDNGGCEALNNTAGNSYPLRGGKFTQWEGGIRSSAFVSGGYLPSSRYNQKEYGMMTIADWYATFCELADIDPFDERAAKYGLPPVDGLNLWPLISGTNSTSPRTELHVDDITLIQGQYKYIVNHSINYASWGGPYFPNSTSPDHLIQETSLNCRHGGCLFDLVNDITEHNDIADANPSVISKMNQRLIELNNNIFVNNVSGTDSLCPKNITESCGCWTANNHWKGFNGPYQNLPST